MEIGVHVDEDAVDFDNPPAELEVYYDNISGSHARPSEDQGSGTRGGGLRPRVWRLPQDTVSKRSWWAVRGCEVDRREHRRLTARPQYSSRQVAHELKVWNPAMSGTFAADTNA